jgi:hypothetical protein
VADQLGTARGLNQFTWDLRGRESGAVNVHAMGSGTYTVRMTLGSTRVSQPLVVLPDPRSGGTAASEREHAAMVAELATMSAAINQALTELRDVRTQARALVEKARGAPVATRDGALQSLVASIDSLESTIVPGSFPEPAPLDIMHFTPRLNTDVTGLLSAVEGTSAPVTSGEREQLTRLRQRVAAFRAAAERVLTTELDRVNASLRETNLTPLLTKPKTP